MQIIGRAPATVANLIVGFDILSLAISGLYDEVILTPNDGHGWRIISIENGAGIPLDPNKNVCTAGMEMMRRDLDTSPHFDVTIRKGYQAGSGLGSSAASAVAALWAYNEAVGRPLSRRAIIPYGMQTEAMVSGHPIADNVAAAALGGIVLIRSADDFISLPVPDLFIGSVFPQVKIITKEARDILPKAFPLQTITRQSGNLAGFISALYSGDLDLLRRSMQDELIEPYRSKLIPRYDDAKKIAEDMGALCFGISGSGPSVFYFSTEKHIAHDIAEKLTELWQEENLEVVSVVDTINTEGVSIRNN